MNWAGQLCWASLFFYLSTFTLMHAAVLTAFLFALTGICAAQSSRRLGAGRANAWRLVVALTLLSAWAHTFGDGFGTGVDAWFLVAGAVGFGLGGWCMLQALRRIGSTLSLLILECAAAIVATAIAWVWLGAALSWTELLFVSMILGGVICGLFPGPIPSVDRTVMMHGAAFALAGACFQAVSFNLSKQAFILLEQSGGQIDQLTAAYQRLLGGAAVALLLYGLGYWLGKKESPPPAATPRTPFPTPVWVFANALFGPVLGVSCMLWAIRLVDNPGIVQAVAATATLLTVPLAYLLEGARPGPRYYAGSLLALAGLACLLI